MNSPSRFTSRFHGMRFLALRFRTIRITQKHNLLGFKSYTKLIVSLYPESSRNRTNQLHSGIKSSECWCQLGRGGEMLAELGERRGALGAVRHVVRGVVHGPDTKARWWR